MCRGCGLWQKWRKPPSGSELRGEAMLRALDSGERQTLVVVGQRGAWGLGRWEDEETWTRTFPWKACRLMAGVGIPHSGIMPDSC